MHLLSAEQAIASFATAVGLALCPFACGGRTTEATENADAEGLDVTRDDDGNVVEGDSSVAEGTSLGGDAALDSRGGASDNSNDALDVQAEVTDAPGDVADAPQCSPNDPPKPVIASNATITFDVTNTASVDRFVLTQATECSAYSIEGETTLIPYQCVCACGALPPETLYFTRLAPGASTTLTWDARVLALYYSYSDCRPEGPYCSSMTHGSPQPVPAASYVIDVVSVQAVPSGTGTSCTLVNGGDVSCTILAQMQFGGRCDPNNIGVQTSTVRQSFMVPVSGATTVAVEVP